MPNWLYLFFNFLYAFGLAIWIGGSLVLGAIAAPILFRAMPRAEAGAIFGPILRRFSRVRLFATILIIAGAGVKYFRWESHATTSWIGVRWVAIAFLALAAVYEITLLEPALARRDESFPRLHKRSERLMSASVAAAMVALFFS